MVVGGGGKNISSIVITGLKSTDTVTCTKDGKSYIATWNDTAQRWEIVGMPLGKFTVTATNGPHTKTETVLIDIAGVYEIEMILLLYLYNDGYECEDVTGGWDKISSDCVITKNDSNMTVTSSSFATGVRMNYFSTINAINLSGYKKLYADISMINGASGYFYLGINDSRTEVHYKSTGYGDNSRSIVTLDISNISGNYYINPYVAARRDYQAVVTVYKVWLE